MSAHWSNPHVRGWTCEHTIPPDLTRRGFRMPGTDFAYLGGVLLRRLFGEDCR